jgi:peptide/nickel transport system ATP-binding protein
MSGTGGPLLEIDHLDVAYELHGQAFRVLRDVSLTVGRADVVGLVGESGCGKSTLGATIVGLGAANARVTGGAIRFDGQDVLSLDEAALHRLRGAHIATISQDPTAALNPLFRVGRQMRDAFKVHVRGSRSEFQARALRAMAEVGISDADTRLRCYPHQFSGGMRQRLVTAMALMLGSELIIADEPTSALDVTTEAQIVELLRRVCAEHGTSLLYITHNIGVVARLCDRVAVMYAGSIVEESPVASLLERPLHPYSRALLGAVPSYRRRGALATIPGSVPGLASPQPGCAFAGRCELARMVCTTRPPDHKAVEDSVVRCHARDGSPDYADSPPVPGMGR